MKTVTRVISAVLCVITMLSCFNCFAATSTTIITNNSDNPEFDVFFYGGHSYRLYHNVAQTWEEAKEFCRSKGGHLATFTTQEESDAVYSYLMSTGKKNAYFGLSDASYEGVWEWVTGEEVNFDNWSEGEPDNGDLVNDINGTSIVENYAQFSAYRDDGTWVDNDFCMHAETLGDSKTFICEWDYITKSFTYNGHVYRIYDRVCETWEEAKEYCEDLGGHLATFTTKAESDAVHSFLLTTGLKNAYFGFSDSKTEGVWEWVNGEEVNFTNWAEGDPDNGKLINDKDGTTIVENYAQFSIYKADGTWVDNDFCMHVETVGDRKTFICEWDNEDSFEKEDTIDYDDMYTQLHWNFVNNNSTNEYKLFRGFANNIWEVNSDNKNSINIAFHVYDGLEFIYKVLSLDINGLFVKEDFYSLYLADIILRSDEFGASDLLYERVFKGYGELVGGLDEIFTSTDEWKNNIKNIEETGFDLKKFLWDPEYNVTDGMKEVVNEVLKESKIYKYSDQIDAVFGGLSNAAQVVNNILLAEDIVGVLQKTLQAYAITDAYMNVNDEFFNIMYAAVDKIEDKNHAKWFKEALDEYKNKSLTYDATFEAVATLLRNGIPLVFKTFCSDATRTLGINTVAAKFGVAPTKVNLVIAAYTATFAVADAMTGLSGEVDLYHTMYYVSSVEKALGLVEKEYANTLRTDKSYENAVKLDCAFNLLKETNLYLYKIMHDYYEKEKKTDGMQIAAMFYNEWNNIYCHTGETALFADSKYSAVHCPVDVYVYDADKNTVLSIVNEKITHIDQSVTALVSGGKKSIVYPADKDYRIEIVAREDGDMNYYVSEIKDGKSVRNIAFYDLSLTEGEAYKGNIPSEFDIESSLYALETNNKKVSADHDSMVKDCGDGNHIADEWTMPESDALLTSEVSRCTECGAELSRTVWNYSAVDLNFTDVPDGKWFTDYIKHVYVNNFFKGVTETEFQPNASMSRGMFVTVLSRIAGVDVDNTRKTKFTDVKTDRYYTGAVEWAAENGIVTGVSATKFKPDDTVTREQMCAMLVRYADFADIEIKQTVAAETFKDGDKISKYAKDAVALCQKAGIVNGMGDGTFAPKATATRAQVAKILTVFHTNCICDLD